MGFVHEAFDNWTNKVKNEHLQSVFERFERKMKRIARGAESC